MKPDAVPFFGVLVAVLLAGVWALLRFELVRFKDDERRQFCKPAIDTGQQRMGRDVPLYGPDRLAAPDLVRYRTPRTGDMTSRVVAVAGQRVEVRDGQLLVDDQPVNEPWAVFRRAEDFYPPLVVPPGCVWVMNDTRSRGRSEAFDSRAAGPIPVDAISYRFDGTPREEPK